LSALFLVGCGDDKEVPQEYKIGYQDSRSENEEIVDHSRDDLWQPIKDESYVAFTDAEKLLYTYHESIQDDLYAQVPEAGYPLDLLYDTVILCVYDSGSGDIVTDVSWSVSEGESVIQIKEQDNVLSVTALAVGEATIEATVGSYSDYETVSTKIIVSKSRFNFDIFHNDSINPVEDADIKIQFTESLNLKTHPEKKNEHYKNINLDVNWTSSNNDIIEITETGFKIKAPGTATLTAAWNGIERSVNINVVPSHFIGYINQNKEHIEIPSEGYQTIIGGEYKLGLYTSTVSKDTLLLPYGNEHITWKFEGQNAVNTEFRSKNDLMQTFRGNDALYIYPLKEGKTTIYAYDNDEKLILATTTIMISRTPIETVKIISAEFTAEQFIGEEAKINLRDEGYEESQFTSLEKSVQFTRNGTTFTFNQPVEYKIPDSGITFEITLKPGKHMRRVFRTTEDKQSASDNLRFFSEVTRDIAQAQDQAQKESKKSKSDSYSRDSEGVSTSTDQLEVYKNPNVRWSVSEGEFYDPISLSSYYPNTYNHKTETSELEFVNAKTQQKYLHRPSIVKRRKLDEYEYVDEKTETRYKPVTDSGILNYNKDKNVYFNEKLGHYHFVEKDETPTDTEESDFEQPSVSTLQTSRPSSSGKSIVYITTTNDLIKLLLAKQVETDKVKDYLPLYDLNKPDAITNEGEGKEYSPLEIAVYYKLDEIIEAMKKLIPESGVKAKEGNGQKKGAGPKRGK
jgi:hypothetical protein